MTPSPAWSPRSWAGSRGGWGRPAATRHPSPARAPRPRRAAGPGDTRLPEAAAAAHGSPGCGVPALEPSLPPARSPARPLPRRVRGRKNGDGRTLALTPAVPTSGSRRRPPAAAAGRARPSPPPPRPESSAPEPGWKRGRAGAASAAWGKATRAPGIRCGGGRCGQRARPLAPSVD